MNYAEQSFAIINALIFAKVMLVADDLKLGVRFVTSPLIHSILYASLIFAVVLVCFHIAEGGVVGLLRGRPIAESLAESGAFVGRDRPRGDDSILCVSWDRACGRGRRALAARFQPRENKVQVGSAGVRSPSAPARPRRSDSG